MSSEIFVGIFLILLCIDRYKVVSDAPAGTLVSFHWFSQPFRYDCVNDCRAEVNRPLSLETNGESNCSNCNGKTIRSSSLTRKDFLKKELRDPRNPNDRHFCMIGVVTEEILCTASSSTSLNSRKITNPCIRRNYRYALPRPRCHIEKSYEIGEESCSDACAPSGINDPTPDIDLNRQRATFKPCYTGLLQLTSLHSNREQQQVQFCRADLSSCSKCFKWGNWTEISPCSKTCGSPGIKSYGRACFIKDQSGLFGRSITLKGVSSRFCQLYLGGNNHMTEECGMRSVCPQWINWGPWSNCDSKEVESTLPQVKRCRTRRGSPQNATELKSNKELPDGHSFQSMPHKTGVVDDMRIQLSIRTRICLPKQNLCPGNSSQTRLCDVKRKQYQVTTKLTDDSECDDDTEFEITLAPRKIRKVTTTQFSKNIAREGIIASNTPNIEQSPAESSTTQNKFRRDKNNRTIYVDTEDYFTTIFSKYALAFIIALLVFIVLLLFALIAICGATVMQRSRRTQYDISPPSFSMGLLPSGLVHGFSHVLGLRHGSGTFGRSEYVSTFSGDGISCRGSCRSLSSNAASKGRSRPLHTGCVGYNCGSMRQHGTQPKVSIFDLQRHHATNESLMGSKKPSSSSLLSSASSAAGNTTGNSCSFHPLPPIPPDLPSSPLNNTKHTFKRGAIRSSSLNPEERNRRTAMAAYFQPRADSVSGRLTQRQSLHDDVPLTPPRRSRNSINRRGASPDSDRYSRRGTNEMRVISDTQQTENEYWSVTREEEESLSSISFQQNPATHAKLPLRSINDRNARRKKLHIQRSYDSSDNVDCNELVDNVLYDKRNEGIILKTPRQSSSDEAILGIRELQNDDQSEGICDKSLDEPVYNSIDVEVHSATSQKGQGELLEDQYDHLCGQFSSPTSVKSRFEFAELQPLTNERENFEIKPDHDYESIERKRQEICNSGVNSDTTKNSNTLEDLPV